MSRPILTKSCFIFRERIALNRGRATGIAGASCNRPCMCTRVPPPSGNGKIGTRQPKYAARDLVLGQHEYVDDIRIAGMKHGALRFSDHPRARVLSIDTCAESLSVGNHANARRAVTVSSSPRSVPSVRST